MNGKLVNGRVIYVGLFQKKKEREKEMRLICITIIYVSNVIVTLSYPTLLLLECVA